MAEVVIRLRALLGFHAAAVAVAVLGWLWYEGAVIPALFMGGYVGTTVVIAVLTLVTLYVGVSNVSIERG